MAKKKTAPKKRVKVGDLKARKDPRGGKKVKIDF